MAVQTGLMTVEEFLRLSSPKSGRHELHHGEVITTPPAKWGHRITQEAIADLLKRIAGEEWLVMVEMPFRPAPEHEVWQADVGVVRADRAKAVGGEEYLMGSPEIVIEVLSPSNTIDEINDRMAICMENGCVSFWIVDDKRHRISVPEGNITKHYSINDTIPVPLMNATIEVRAIFGK